MVVDTSTFGRRIRNLDRLGDLALSHERRGDTAGLLTGASLRRTRAEIADEIMETISNGHHPRTGTITSTVVKGLHRQSHADMAIAAKNVDEARGKSVDFLDLV